MRSASVRESIVLKGLLVLGVELWRIEQRVRVGRVSWLRLCSLCILFV